MSHGLDSHAFEGGYAPANLLTQWARLLVGTLCALGARRFVLSPGSRNTPLVAAVLQCAQAEHWVVVDERAAGFFALAQAKCSGAPSVLVCTSGSAVGHYLPAVLEAERARVPLIVVSADRPSHLQANGAPQTTDQTHLFGHHVRAFFELGLASANVSGLLAVRRKMAQAVALAGAPLAGPVHVNVPASKPLEPRAAQTNQERALEAYVEQLLSQGPPRIGAPMFEVEPAALRALGEAVVRARRPVLVLGPDAPFEALASEALHAFDEKLGWPVWCEVTNQARWSDALTSGALCDGYDLLLQAGAPDELQPDLILQFGAPPTSAAYAHLLASGSSQLWIAATSGYPDPENRAHAVLRVNPTRLLERLVQRLERAEPWHSWQRRWQRANHLAWSTVEEWAAQSAAQDFDEAQLVWELGQALGHGDLLLLGNSLPVRVAENFLRGARASHTLSQRGVNGIDGMLATAAGAASLHSGRVVALIGDVTALHDIGSLQLLSQLRRPLLLLIVNNHGGRIFEQLPIASHTNLDAWTTPHRFDLRAIANAFGVEARRVESRGEFVSALERARRLERPFVVEACVAASGARQALSAVRRALCDRLAAEA